MMQISIADNTASAVISSLGAEVQSYRVYGRERIWQRDPSLWDGSATVLFPFIGRCREDRYLLRGRSYPMGLHGFAWREEFQVLRQGDAACLLELTDSADTRRLYPFSFSLRIGFSLQQGVLSVRFQVQNRSPSPMPFALGWHPGFLLEEELERYTALFPDSRNPREVEIVPRCMVTGNTLPLGLDRGVLPLSPALFSSRARPYRGVGSRIQLRLSPEEPLLQMEYPGFPITTLWQTVGSGAPFLCVEPWLGRPGRYDAVEELEQSGKVLLPPGGSLRRAVSVSFSDRQRARRR